MERRTRARRASAARAGPRAPDRGARSAGARLSRRPSRCAARARPWPTPTSCRRRRPCAAGGAGRASARPAARRSGPPPALPARPRCRGWPPRRAAGRWPPPAPRLRAGAARSGRGPGRGGSTGTGGTSLILARWQGWFTPRSAATHPAYAGQVIHRRSREQSAHSTPLHAHSRRRAGPQSGRPRMA